MATAKLARYRTMRDFDLTAEPAGDLGTAQPSQQRRFVIQKHDATRLHFDLRLESGGVFKSWAVTRGPSLNPHDKRLAVAVEDHPLAYGDFEGVIPKGQYGGGTVQLWDRGHWAPETGFEDVERALAAGELKFNLEGKRLHGGWVLVRLKGDRNAKRDNWLLIKHRDRAAIDGDGEALAAKDCSVASGRSMAEIAAGKGCNPKPFMRAARGRKAAHSDLPRFIAPQLCRPVARPPGGDGWAHEIKFDGYRMQLRTLAGKATLLTRTGLDWSARFPAIVTSGAALHDGIMDGEIVALGHTGAPDFAALQAAISDEMTNDLIFFAFDLLFAGAEDIRSLALSARKQRLEHRLAGAPANIRYVAHFTSAGDTVLRSACRMNLEGIVSKRLDAPYRSGRSDSWAKSKCRQGHEVVIGGWTTTGTAFRSLIAGVHRNGRLVHVGRIGTGFGRDTVARLMPKLAALATDKNPFTGAGAPGKTPGTHWLKPQLVAEIAYAGFTADGAIRQAAFKGLRADKPAAEVQAESPSPAAAAAPHAPAPAKPGDTIRPGGSVVVMGVTVSHADKALWPDALDGKPVTKGDLARYYAAVGDWLLPHVRGRPCSLLRMPDGIGAARFFQRHAARGGSSLFTDVAVPGEQRSYLQIDQVEALIAAAQIGAVELHPWNSAPFAPEQPGRLVFDLDPGPGVAFDDVITAARDVRDFVAKLGLVAFCKTTGGHGLHVVTPLAPEAVDWASAKAFAREVCRRLAAAAPERFVITMAKKQRAGRIFLDYLRNDRLATAVAPLSPRGRPGAPVSMPLGWGQVRRGLNPAIFTIRTVPALLRKTTAWRGYDKAARSLSAAIARL
jgi:bifunctional non-homologous end joining protein LigD